MTNRLLAAGACALFLAAYQAAEANEGHCNAMQVESIHDDFFVLYQQHRTEPRYQYILKCQTRLFMPLFWGQEDYCVCEHDWFYVGSVYYDAVDYPFYSAENEFDFELSAEEAVGGATLEAFIEPLAQASHRGHGGQCEQPGEGPLYLEDTGVQSGAHQQGWEAIWRQWGHIFAPGAPASYRITSYYGHDDPNAAPYETWDIALNLHVVPHSEHVRMGSPGVPGGGTVVCPAYITGH